MITVVQIVAGATQFNATAGQGLVIFEDLIPLPSDSPDIVPILTNVALQGDNATTLTQINCRLFRNGGAASENLPIRFLSDPETGFTSLGCRIPVPRDFSVGADGPAWRLALTTTGKTIDMSFIASFELGHAILDDV